MVQELRMENSDRVKDWMETVPAVAPEEPITAPLERLQRYGVAVLKGRQGLPLGILTLSDLSRVLDQGEQTASMTDAKAVDLFPHTYANPISTVREDDSILMAAQKLAAWKFRSGLPVVDDKGSYKGYLFLKDLKLGAEKALKRIDSEIDQKVQILKKAFPAQWISIAKQLPLDCVEGRSGTGR